MKVKEVIFKLNKLPDRMKELPFTTYDEINGEVKEVEKIVMFQGDEWLKFEGKAILVK